MIRWSDGSLTLQIGSDPMVQHELVGKPLAPRPAAPLRSKPSAVKRGPPNGHDRYDPKLDSHIYLVSAHESIGFAQITNHITASLSVQSSINENDDALIRLQESMAAAVKGNKRNADGGLAVIDTIEDPELAKRKAEQAEKEKLRVQRRRQTQEERERDRANRVLGRAGLRTGGMGAGLTVGGLEDDGLLSARPKARPAPRTRRRRNSEYSDEEEGFGRRGRTKEDEYDRDDGFLVRSDEEPEVVSSESEEEESLLDEDEDEDEERLGKAAPKESVEPAAEAAAGGVRTKRRRIIEEDEE
jgi:RNA polymerase-associated protein LEO1